VHRGDDTAYYLHKGFRVVGVEANPVMADHLRNRFTSEIASGALLALDLGNADLQQAARRRLAIHVQQLQHVRQQPARPVAGLRPRGRGVARDQQHLRAAEIQRPRRVVRHSRHDVGVDVWGARF